MLVLTPQHKPPKETKRADWADSDVRDFVLHRKRTQVLPVAPHALRVLWWTTGLRWDLPLDYTEATRIREKQARFEGVCGPDHISNSDWFPEP